MFEGARILLVALAELVLPAATLRLCDGGLIGWPGVGMFTASDPEFGAIGSVDPAAEAIGDQAPGGRMTLLVPDVSAAVALADPAAQGAPLRFWLAQADPDLGTVIGTPELLFEGEVDTVSLSLTRGAAEVGIEYVSAAERLFEVKEGNVLSDRFHQAAWPGETGFALTTGTATQVPWGTGGVPRGAVIAEPASSLFQ